MFELRSVRQFLVSTPCAAEDAGFNSMRERRAHDCALRACLRMGYLIVQCIDSARPTKSQAHILVLIKYRQDYFEVAV